MGAIRCSTVLKVARCEILDWEEMIVCDSASEMEGQVAPLVSEVGHINYALIATVKDVANIHLLMNVKQVATTMVGLKMS